jgi:hypothetical protein
MTSDVLTVYELSPTLHNHRRARVKEREGVLVLAKDLHGNADLYWTLWVPDERFGHVSVSLRHSGQDLVTLLP